MAPYARLAAPLAVFLCAACAPPASEQNAIIERIESELKLPEGALPLHAYSRYHARDRSGVIKAGYTAGDDDKRFEDVAETCRVLKRAKPGLTEMPFPCPRNGGAVRLVKAGNSLWVERPQDLPAMSGGAARW